MTPRPAVRALAALLGALALAATVGLPAAAATTGGGSDDGAVVALDARGAGVDDFTFDSFDAVLELGRDDAGRSTLRTTETLVAVFPDADQNRGIRRAIPLQYQGHDTRIRIESVTDETGAPRFYTEEEDGEFHLVTIAVPVGQFVHGAQTYVITYTQADVTATLTDPRDGVTRDEFQWDVNGTGWAQPFGRVTADVRVAADLVPALTGDVACYQGVEGSTDPCEVALLDGVVSARAMDLGPRENLTVAVGFARGTFAGVPWWETVPILPLLSGLLTLGGAALALVTRFTAGRDAPGRGIVVAQYEPPPGLGIFEAANLVKATKRGMAASLVDAAVTGGIRLIERDAGWGRREFGVEPVDLTRLTPAQRRATDAVLGIDVTGVHWLEKGDTVLGTKVVALTKGAAKAVLDAGLRRKMRPGATLLAVGAFVLAGVLLVIHTVSSPETFTGVGLGVIGLNVIPWVAIGTAGLVAGRRPLTKTGAETREHLDGLREFIRVAEADRLQMLQSVTGAERVDTAEGKARVVKIYEKLLPYAVLFGLEKEWATEISRYYDETPPDWYAGSNAFSAAALASGLSSMSSSVSTSYSGSASSSSSGGSGGGGSSGGGGGGGGGGGV